jgi:hypothetical protein
MRGACGLGSTGISTNIIVSDKVFDLCEFIVSTEMQLDLEFASSIFSRFSARTISSSEECTLLAIDRLEFAGDGNIIALRNVTHAKRPPLRFTTSF